MENQSRQTINAFSTSANGIMKEIIIDCGISIVFDQPNEVIKKDDSRIYYTKALWDTGATHSVITEAVAQKLDLKPIAKTNVTYGRETHLENVYLVNIYLPNHVVIPFVRVTECEDTNGRFGLIIGMDIITLGDFSITNINKKTTMSFRIPSIQTIDYVKEIKDKSRVGRNTPCPCGSGRKYKKCCGIN